MCSKLSGKSIGGLNAYIMSIYFIVGMAFSFVAANIDTFAHIGGFIGGILSTILVLKTHKNTKEVMS